MSKALEMSRKIAPPNSLNLKPVEKYSVTRRTRSLWLNVLDEEQTARQAVSILPLLIFFLIFGELLTHQYGSRALEKFGRFSWFLEKYLNGLHQTGGFKEKSSIFL